MLVEPDYAGMVRTVLARSSRRSLVVLLTALDTAPVEAGLLPVLAPLVHRHQVVIASVSDPRILEMAGSRGDAEAVYDAAAAERSRAERRRLAELLGRRGVEVVDSGPATLAPDLADRYLALKAAGRL
jgi:uncharacterized protein (DUF58 family)